MRPKYTQIIVANVSPRNPNLFGCAKVCSEGYREGVSKCAFQGGEEFAVGEGGLFELRMNGSLGT